MKLYFSYRKGLTIRAARAKVIVKQHGGVMKKKLTLTIDPEVYDSLKHLPRGVSISEVVSWMLRAMVEDVKPGGMTEDEFLKFMDNDPRGHEVREYIREKLGPLVYPVRDMVSKEKAKGKDKRFK